MRILFATEYLHVPQGGGGGERNTHELCLALQAAGDAPAVSCMLRPEQNWLSWSTRVRRKLPPRREFVPDTGCGYPVYRGWNHPLQGEIVGRFRPDVVVVQGTDPQQLIETFRRAGVPVLAYFHEVDKIDHLGFLADAGIPVLANSSFTAQRLHDRFGLQCEVVLPLVDPAHYTVPSTRPERVLYVNTMPRKGCEIAFQLAERRPDIPFTFMQSWTHRADEAAAIQARAAKAGNIELRMPTGDMRPIYARAKLLLAPSQWEETWGRVATEAHINGVPVIGSDRGGLPQAIGPGGIVVPYQAPAEQWAAALGRLWDDPAAYDAASAAARAYAMRPEIQPATLVAGLRRVLQGAVLQQRGAAAA